ncbi:MAG TPA: ABC transporter permease [Opitutus sp.]|nr:ABC transporter permease [Opitutus sp.]
MKFWSKLRSLFRRRKLEAEMAEEMRVHLEMLEERKRAEGMSAEEARFAARREFGGVEQIKERCRDVRHFIWLEHFVQDMGYALRTLRRNPMFAAVAILSLALGVGPNAVVFSLINDRLLKSLPVKDPSVLVLFEWVNQPAGKGPSWSGDVGTPDKDPATGQPAVRVFSKLTFEEIRQHSQSLQDVFATAPNGDTTLSVDGQSEAARLCELVSGNYFQALGVRAALGRTISADDDRPGAPPVAVLSHRYWRSRFGADPGVLGKVITVNGQAATIIGVAQAGFDGTMLGGGMTSVMLPLATAPLVHREAMEIDNPGRGWLRIMGRLRAGVSPAQALAEVEPIYRSSVSTAVRSEKDIPSLRVVPGGSGWSQGDRRLFAMFLLPLLGMVSLVLVTACANLANLLLARGAARRTEIATRLALGAGRSRIVRQLLTENVVVAVAGSALGLALSVWGLQLLSALLPPLERPLLSRVVIDWRVMLMTAATAIATGMIFGLAPALRCTRLNLMAEFQGGSRNVKAQAKSKLSRTLIVIQVSVAVVLLAFAGLFIGTVRNLYRADIGFDRGNLLLFSANFSDTGYSASRTRALLEQLAGEFSTIAGAQAVGYSNWGFIAGEAATSELTIPGRLFPAGKVEVVYNRISPGFFGAYGIKLLFGREFTSADHADGAKVAVVNQAFARSYFDGVSPLGRFIGVLGERQIVGVAADAKEVDIRDATAPTVFIPFGQDPGVGAARFAIRFARSDIGGLARAVREKIQAVDPKLTVSDLRTQDEQVARSLTGERLISSLASYLGLLALALASVGLFGLVSYGVAQRQREIGVRMALGARPRSILLMIFRESFRTVGIGLVVGVLAALLVTRLAAGIFFGVSSSAPLIYAAIVALLAGIAGLACWLPARRAAKVDPMVALRCE